MKHRGALVCLSLCCMVWPAWADDDAEVQARLQNLVQTFLRCDGALYDVLHADGAWPESLRHDFGRKWTLPIKASFGKLWIEDLQFRIRQQDSRQEIIWILNVQGPPDETYPTLARWLPKDGGPIQKMLKHGKPRYVHVESIAKDGSWTPLLFEEAKPLLIPGALAAGGVRTLYFGRAHRATSSFVGQADSVLTSVQCGLVTESPELATKLRALAKWPDMLPALPPAPVDVAPTAPAAPPSSE